jgi:DNA mismatch repair protein MutL
MSKIRILPDRVANQIAAGEVIERPAAVVKELVENALDAGASRVEVEFRDGGRSFIRVEDDGQGMSRDDALLALERHATSKIAEASDLDRLASYGFRGEALPSIASVSRFTMQTRTADGDAGTEVVVNGGRILNVRDCGRPVGTRVEVSHLFHPVPARRKFLKTDRTEAAHIVQCVRLYALACPQVAFALVEDGRTVFSSPPCSGLPDRLAEIFGRRLASELMAVDAAEPGMSLKGLIGRPGAGSPTRHEMIVFVNSRPVDSRAVNYALVEGYHELLPNGRHPIAFVFLECDPAGVDVNVHPAKREVRFRNEPAVRSFVTASVRRRLLETGSASGWQAAPAPELVGEAPAGVPPLAPSGFAGAAFPVPAAPGPAAAGVPKPGEAAGRHGWRYVGLVHGGYGLFETGAGLVIMDRRAAHERVWFERLREQFLAGAVPSQRLLLPAPIEVDPVGAALLLDRRDFLEVHGFEVAEFGRNFFRIEAVPAWMEPADAEPFLRDLLGALREGRFPGNDPDLARDEMARLAAAKAVRLPAAQGEAEMAALATALLETRAPLTSPAGRPTFIEVGLGELARRFQK